MEMLQSTPEILPCHEPLHEHIWKCCNHAVTFIVSSTITRTNMEAVVSSPIFIL